MKLSSFNFLLQICHYMRLISLSRPSFSVQKQLEALRGASPQFNVSNGIISLTDRKLLHIQNHPLCIIKERIRKSLGSSYESYDNISPVVTVQKNFDVLNIPSDHVSRSPADTFYINDKLLLRTHTSAHQVDFLTQKLRQFVVFGDVYRRDEIDRYHYPVFHQMEAVSMLGDSDHVTVEQTVNDLKITIQKVIDDLFGKCEKKWVDAYFPFTEPSFELQIFYGNKWVEMLGCGVIHKEVLRRAGRQNERGWAAGLGLERLAMKLFNLPDVRLFWSKDPRFLSQFQKGKITEFKQFSKYPTCFKELSMWISEGYNPNDLFGIIREIGGDLIQNVEEVSTYIDPKTNKTSKSYKIHFRSLERTLENEEIVKYQFQIRDEVSRSLSTVILR